ncbi:sugar/nucleoside kinase (ribokinase family) [Paenibacillus taihuensis]|uniref:Sugar/nucleoside kinase (Ribokinase family) n=1 Tax=Paenibacillus taihuensis TaxID=1156355 RepID=A0A3D9RPA5_9BACL|nr:sugar kinase [Paenibacillus taihuensis]REE78593.1 sugar/nucleoside kinase (ribokinase family) [Paenibacillus taihuensis]
MPLPSVKKVIVVGELNVDLIFADSNIVPEPNREKLVRDFRLALGSSSAIAAAGLAGLGLEVAFVSIVGDDEFGHFCLRELARLGVDVSHVVVDSSVRTGVTLSLTDERDRSLLTFMGSIGSVTPSMIPEKLFREASHVHFGSYFLQDAMRPHWLELFKLAKACGMTTSFDAGWDPAEHWDRERLAALLAYADWFIPSEEEALQIFEAGSVEELPTRLPAGRGAVIVKCGSAGSAGVYADGRVVYSPPFTVQPVDTTGAGDSFNAGFIAAKLRGESDREALEYANACGALSTLAIGGAGTVTLDGVARFWPEGRWLA